MNKGPVKHIVIFFLILLFQVIVAKNVVLFGVAFPFVYILFLLLLPVDLNRNYGLLLGFSIGLIVDVFYNTGGIHAASSVAIMFLRDRWLGAITPQGGFELGEEPALSTGGIAWFSTYALPIIFIHHCILFFLESYGFSMFWFTLNKAFFSTIFTFVFCLLLLVITGRSKR